MFNEQSDKGTGKEFGEKQVPRGEFALVFRNLVLRERFPRLRAMVWITRVLDNDGIHTLQTNDGDFHMSAFRSAAWSLQARATEVRSSHLRFLSPPKVGAKIIAAAAMEARK